MFRPPCAAQPQSSPCSASPWRLFSSSSSSSTAGDSTDEPAIAEVPGRPSVEFVSPRNGAVQRGTAVVVKAELENFRLAPRRFGGEPLLGEGSLRFSLNRVPDCVEPEKLRKAEESAIGKGRLVGASFDYPKYAGPNGVLGARIGSSGSYSPATRPEIFYSGLRPGLLPPRRHARRQRRHDDPLPRRDQLPDPRETEPRDRRLRRRQGLQRRGRGRGRAGLEQPLQGPILHFV